MTEFDRRGMLGLVGAGTALGALPGLAPGLALAAPRRGSGPWLGSPEQLWAERTIMTLEREPAVLRIGAQIKAELMGEARAKIPDAAATLDESIAQWTRSLVMHVIGEHPTKPYLYWGTDDTPRSWMGHTLGGVGTSGDNPDAVYISTVIAGGGRYEILGQYHPDSRPTQLQMEVNAGTMADIAKVMGDKGSGKHHDMVSTSMATDETLVVAPDGSFRIVLASTPRTPADGPNFMAIPAAGLCSLGARNILTDWRQRPCRLRMRRLDRVRPVAQTVATVRAAVLANLGGYMRFWSHFPDMWFGGLKPNQHSDPMGRPGGWGYVAGLNFSLAPDEAMVVTTTTGGAKYTGFQLNNPWMIAPDAKLRQVCLNNSQTVPNADGSQTYVISQSDPGVANWLDTAGMRDGIGILRWQAIPKGLGKDGLIREVRVTKLADLASLGLARVTPDERRSRIAARAVAYASRAT